MRTIEKVTGQFSSYDGTKIYYEVRGKGEPLIFAYGIGCLMNHFNPQINYFSKKYKVITFDYRGHNKSEVPKDMRHFTLEAFTKDIQCLLEHLEIKKAHFVAHSFGAQVLTKTYDLNPSIFKSLTFINGFVSNPISGMFGSNIPTKVFELIRGGFEKLPNAFTTFWKYSVNNPLAIPLSALAGGFNLSLTSYKDIEIYAKALSHMDLECFISLFEQMMNYDGRGVLSRIKVPTLIISGKKDSVTPIKHQVAMHELIENSEITVMPYGTHCTQLDLAEYVNIRIEKFFFDHFSQPRQEVEQQPSA